MKNTALPTVILPTVDQDVKLVSHGTTLVVEKNHSIVEEYALTCIPGTRTTDWSREEVEQKISELLQKGWEYAK